MGRDAQRLRKCLRNVYAKESVNYDSQPGGQWQDELVMTQRITLLFVIVNDNNEDDNDKNAHHFEKIICTRNCAL